MLGASIVVTILTLFSGFLGFLNQAILAKIFGATTQMDIFLAATSIPTFIFGTLGAGMSFTITPHLINRKSQYVDYEKYGGMLLLSILAIGTLMALIGIIFTPIILQLLIPHTTSALMANAILVARVAWITGPVGIATIYLTCVLNVADRFIVPSAVGTIPYLFMSIFVLLFGKTLGPLSISLGYLLGTMTSCIALLYPTLKSIRFMQWFPEGYLDVRNYIFQIPIYLIAMACFTIYQSIDSFWGIRLGVGNLATLGYAQRILIAVGNLVISGPSAVLMPKLTRAHLEGGQDAFLFLVMRLVRLVFACASFVAVVVSLLAVHIIRLLFARGAFDQLAITKLSNILPYMLVGMIFMLVVVILFRVLFSQKNTTAPATIGILCASIYFILSGLLSPHYGLKGIGFAYIISWAMGLFIALAAIWKHRLRLLFALENAIFVSQLLASIALTGVILKIFIYFFEFNLSSAHGFALLVWISSLSFFSFIVFWTATVFIFKIPETIMLNQFFINFFVSKFNPNKAKLPL